MNPKDHGYEEEDPLIPHKITLTTTLSTKLQVGKRQMF